MSTCFFSDFIDISEFTLHGDEDYVALVVVPIQELEDEDQYDEISVEEVEFPHNLLTPCLQFVHHDERCEELSEFDLECEMQIEEMILEELQAEAELSQDFGIEEQSVGFDLLDVLQRQLEIMAQRNSLENCQKDFLSSSTSVTDEVTVQKTYDFDQFEFQQNADYPFETRRDKVERYLKKRKNRNWNKKISYKCRKEVADSRLRVKGRFVTRVQANKMLGINTANMSIDLIRTLLEAKFGKESNAETEEGSGKEF